MTTATTSRLATTRSNCRKCGASITPYVHQVADVEMPVLVAGETKIMTLAVHARCAGMVPVAKTATPAAAAKTETVSRARFCRECQMWRESDVRFYGKVCEDCY